MPSYRLTRRAETDLLEIFLFGLERFGDCQAERYSLGFERCLQRLADNPRLGRSADTVTRGLRRHEWGRHVIFYEESPEGILVIAVIHARSLRHLDL